MCVLVVERMEILMKVGIGWDKLQTSSRNGGCERYRLTDRCMGGRGREGRMTWLGVAPMRYWVRSGFPV